MAEHATLPVQRTAHHRRWWWLAAAAAVVVLAGCDNVGEATRGVSGNEAWVANYTYQSAPGDSVSAVNLAGRSVDGVIGAGSEPAGLALTPNGQELLVTNQGSDTVSVVSTITGQVTNTIPVGIEPDAVAIAPSVNGGPVLAMVANFASNTVTPVNLSTMRPGASIPVGDEPDALAVVSGGTGGFGVVVVCNFQSNSINFIDLGTLKNAGAFPVGVEPDGIAVTSHGSDLSIVVTNFGSNTLSIVDVTKRTSSTVPVGSTPTDIALSRRTQLAWVTGGDTLTSFDPQTQQVGTPIKLPSVAEAVALSSDGDTAWVAEQNGTLVPVDLVHHIVGRPIHVGGRPSDVVVADG